MTNEDIQRALDRLRKNATYHGDEAEDWTVDGDAETIRTCLQERLATLANNATVEPVVANNNATTETDYKAIAEEMYEASKKIKVFVDEDFQDGCIFPTPAYKEAYNAMNKSISKYEQAKGENINE